MRVLVAEDDEGLRSVIERGLRENGYVVDVARDGETALRRLRSVDYAVAIVDWRMPKLDGIDVIRGARTSNVAVPVLMLTARDAPADRVTGLESGADDYLVKPFDFAELLARLRALQRRPSLALPAVLECGNVRFDPATRETSIDNVAVALTSTESSLLELLLRRSPSLVTRRAIALQVWDNEADAVGSNTIEVHVARLRAKLAESTARIETIRGTGYRLSPP